MELTMTGQVSFNKGLLEHLGIKAGEKISVTRLPGGKLEVTAAVQQISFSDFRKVAEVESRKVDTGIRLSIEDIQSAMSQSHIEHVTRRN